LAEPLARAFALVRERLRDRLNGEGEIHLALGAGGAAVIALETEGAQPPELYRALEELVHGGALAGVALRASGATKPAVWGDPRERAPGADGRELVGPIAGFSQANEGVNEALVTRAVELAELSGAAVLELFAGSGNLTVAMAARAAHVVAVELTPDAAEACRENVRARAATNVRVVTADAVEHVEGAIRSRARFDVVVLDPPRAGARTALAAVTRLAPAPARIAYVSCDPATLGRDARELAADGYCLDAVEAFDMFPQTAHLEVVARFVRALPGGGGGGSVPHA